MKKSYLKILAFCLAVLPAFCAAAPVDSTVAKQIAFRFYNSLPKSEYHSLEDFHIVETYRIENGFVSFTNFYCFNIGANGFVIVGADDRIEPVLGYSYTGHFDNSIVHNNLLFLLSEYDREIDSVLQSVGVQDVTVEQKWSSLLRDSVPLRNSNVITAVPALLSTTWNQGYLYNSCCPADAAGPGGHVYAGCVATAMAQIINYWKYPVNPEGSITYYADNSSQNYGNYGLLSINFDTVFYDYSAMPNSLGYQSNYVEKQNVASLIYHCGLSISMIYSPMGSVGFVYLVPAALTSYFKYLPSCQYIQRSSYSDSAWQQIITNEIDQQRPVCYGGQGNAGGHAFVCDGYDDLGFFHINWGWGGAYDGYFLLSNLGYGNYSFNSSQDAVIGICTEQQPLPVAVTGDASNITDSSAHCNARAYVQGQLPITDRGLCWSTSPSPTIADNSFSAGTGSGVYECTLTNLMANTRYYVRSYATNDSGITYGNQMSFETNNPLAVFFDANGGEGTMDPQYFMVGISQNLSAATFTRVGYTFSGWNTEPDGSGISYNDQQTIILSGSLTLYAQWSPITCIITLIPTGVDTFVTILTCYYGDSLTLPTAPFSHPDYVFLGWNTMADGSGEWFSPQQTIVPLSNMTLFSQWESLVNNESLSCPVLTILSNEIGTDSIIYSVLDHESNLYNVVRIGNQCWLRENMRCTTSPTTGTIVLINSSDSNAVSLSGKYAVYYQNLPANAADGYGILYNWNAAMDTFNVMFGEVSASTNASSAVSAIFPNHRRGICPKGWHIPSAEEWNTLTTYLQEHSNYVCGEGANNIAQSMASEMGWVSYMNDCCVGNSSSANNTSFLSLTPSGTFSGQFNGMGYLTSVWSATEAGMTNAFTQNLAYNLPYSSQIPKSKNLACSVRCLRDIIPSLSHAEAVLVTKDSAIIRASLLSDGNSDILDYGFCWNTSGSPTLSDYHTSSHSNTNTFVGYLTNLVPNTTYFVRAYATNESGTSFGYDLAFTTDCDTVFQTFEATACDFYFWNGQVYSASGQYYQLFPSHNGCDSLVSLNLTINPLPSSGAITGNNEICRNQIAEYHYLTNENYHYTWLKNNEIIAEDVPAVQVQEQESGIVILSVFTENPLTGCCNSVPLMINVSEYVSPDQTIIRRQGSSNILVCQPVSSDEGVVHYQWGQTNIDTDEETFFDGDYNYFLFESGIDTTHFRYWVETYINYGESSRCSNRTYYEGNTPTAIQNIDGNLVNAYFYENYIKLHVKPANVETVSISVFNLDGKFVIAKKYGVSDEFDDLIYLPSITSGLYFLKVNIGKSVYVLKLLKL